MPDYGLARGIRLLEFDFIEANHRKTGLHHIVSLSMAIAGGARALHPRYADLMASPSEQDTRCRHRDHGIQADLG